MRTLSSILLALSCTFLASCGWFAKKPEVAAPPSADSKYSMHDLDSLIVYAGQLANLDASGREEECRHIQQLMDAAAGLGLYSHLLLVQGLVETCGDRQVTISKLDVFMPTIKDERLHHFLAYQGQILRRLETESEARKELDRQLKTSQDKIKQTHKRMKTRESELKNLKDKLDLLKSIEQNLGNPEEGH